VPLPPIFLDIFTGLRLQKRCGAQSSHRCFMINDIEELKKHIYCEIEIDEYDDGHLNIECMTCNKILLEIYPLLSSREIKERLKNGKNYHISKP
jgi:hypothetical protein